MSRHGVLAVVAAQVVAVDIPKVTWPLPQAKPCRFLLAVPVAPEHPLDSLMAAPEMATDTAEQAVE